MFPFPRGFPSFGRAWVTKKEAEDGREDNTSSGLVEAPGRGGEPETDDRAKGGGEPRPEKEVEACGRKEESEFESEEG